jgi:hypothetical protein
VVDFARLLSPNDGSRAVCEAEMRAPFRAIRIPGEHTRSLVGKLAEILHDQRPTRKVAAMFIDMAFGSPIYERLRLSASTTCSRPTSV